MDHNDWKLPTSHELTELYGDNRINPIGGNVDGLWTDTTTPRGWKYGVYVDSARVVECDPVKGTQVLHAIGVREGKKGLEWSKQSDSTVDYDEAVEYVKTLGSEVYYTGSDREPNSIIKTEDTIIDASINRDYGIDYWVYKLVDKGTIIEKRMTETTAYEVAEHLNLVSYKDYKLTSKN